MIGVAALLIAVGLLFFVLGVRYRLTFGLWMGAVYLGVGFLGVVLVLSGAE